MFSVNFKLGFDLTEGENGAPSLRIRDFEGNVEPHSMLNSLTIMHTSIFQFRIEFSRKTLGTS